MGHNTHTTTHALLLVSLVFLLVRRRVDGGPAVVSSRRLCNHKQCFVAVPERYDFEGSREQCKERTGGGHLMTVQSPDLHKDLVRLLRGHYTGNYWIGLQLPVDKCPDSASPLRGYRWIIDDKATDFNNWGPASSSVDALCAHRCVSVGSGTDNNSTWAQETCDTVTEGFICEYPLVEPCAPLAHSAEYTVYAMPELKFDEESAAYPQGTIAVERPSGLKHICAEHRWIPAPWSCDVLNGGCGDVCRDHACACSAPGSTLRANNVTCSAPSAPALPGEELEADPCSGGGDGYLAAGEDREGCVDDVDMKRGNNECLDRDGCAGDGERPEECAEGYVLEDGVCVSVEICDKCEHMKCELSDGVYQCFCRNGFVVWDKDPTRCLQHCDRRDCPSNCIEPSDPKEEPQCYCPGGYIQDRRNGTSVCTDIDECEQARQCDHTCVNTYGSYTCLCDAGFDLYLGYKCIAAAGGGDDGSGGGGSTSTSHYISASNAISPTVIPPYIKTGSVLGIVVFVALFVGLSCFVVHRALRRCRTFEIASSLRGADHVQDIFHLQQVMTEKYKRFSFDKQWDNNDHQRQ